MNPAVGGGTDAAALARMEPYDAPEQRRHAVARFTAALMLDNGLFCENFA